jgi:threonine aldolase
LVYISNPTEYGTVYTKDELKAIRAYCDEKNLLVYCDGARLGMALSVTDVTMKDIYELTDAFFIGGTKVGALIGEAIVIRHLDVKEEFRYLTKQRGALLAKGRLLGIQFNTLFESNLYFELAQHSVDMAQKIQIALREMHIEFLIDSPTNQVFPILNNDIIEALSIEYGFYVWEKVTEDLSAVRLITSWCTKEDVVNDFIKDVSKLKKR